MDELNLDGIQFKAKYICPFIPELDKTLSKFDSEISKKYELISRLKHKRKSDSNSS